MTDIDEVFRALTRSAFRQRFHLKAQEATYLQEKGLETVIDHARDFIDRRLAPPYPSNDGRQTPFHGHPVFVAQHATATCCRSCLEKWHRIPRGRALDHHERAYVLSVLRHWLRFELDQR